MATIFTKIVNGEIPSHKVAEDHNYFAFLDIRPLAKGHTLVIPKRAVDYVFDMEDDELGGLMVFAKKVAKALKTAVPCAKIGVSVVGLEVPHTHIHLIPINAVADMSFAKEPIQMEQEELAGLAAAIRANF